MGMRVCLLWCVASGLFVALSGGLNAADQPNLIIFYADDLGWGELGCQGSKDIPTPHIDALATNGMRCTNGYVAACYCSPSRAGLMTGRYPTRFGHEFNSTHNRVGLVSTETTLAERLKSAGYATTCIGKWHLGGQPESRPQRRGFDEFYGTLANTPFYHPREFVDSRTSDDPQPVTDPEFYTTDAYADRAVAWLAARRSEPWFLYLPFNAQHAPLQAPQKYLDRFSQISDEKRRTFAAMLSAMDDAVGRVMQQVRESAQEEETLVFFIGDNGGPTPSTTSFNGPLHGFKSTTWEGGPRVPFLVQWRGTIPAGKVYELPVMNLDVMPTALTAAGVEIPATWKLDGVDLLPFLTGKNTSRPHETLYWRFGEQWAVRHGDDKLVVARGGSGQPELYNLAADIGEQHNLATAQPEKVRELQALWDRWNAEQAPASAPDAPANKKAKRKKTAQ